ncbi:hypothetical protein MED121_10969 [Marinomonas sp. MED121]|uniref:hypothetical protein n=1 Tax=Marinomonas sp. MED121 TaxID=314277 RepID=UPI0000690C6B|nr:hypothetical protein [Marinomonas sp. MED121]EAQ64880.1 hypothetical protein MED121_10969 [Marinomonas sp. MED121]
MKKPILPAVMLASVFSMPSMAEVPLSGVWTLQDSNNTQETLDSAIEGVVQEMNFLFRAIGRTVLKRETHVCHSWMLATTDESFLWQCDEIPANELALSANQTETMSDDGRLITGSYKEGDRYVATILESERGKRTNLWRMVSENELEYTTTLESDKIPKPLTWKLTYTRN